MNQPDRRMPSNPVPPYQTPPHPIPTPNPGFPVDCTYLADSRTARSLSRTVEIARWRSARSWVLLAAIPLVLMSRRIFEIFSYANQSGASPFELISVYLVLLALTVVVAALATGVRMMKRNRQVNGYAAAGMHMWVRYHQNSMEVPPATGYTTFGYDRIKDVLVVGGSVFIRPEGGHGFALPRELVPEFAVKLLRSGGPGSQLPSARIDPAAPTSARFARRRWVTPLVAASAAMAIAVVVLTAIGLVALRNDGDGRTTIATSDHAFGGEFALDPVTRTLYVTNEVGQGSDTGSTLSVVDLSSNKVTATIPLPSDPRGIALDAGTRTLYIVSGTNVGGTGEGVVTVVNVATNSVTATIPIGRNSSWLAVDENTHTTYVLNRTNYGTAANPQDSADASLSVIPPGATVANAPVPVRIVATSLAIDSHTAYVANAWDMDVIDLATNSPITVIPMPFDPELTLFDHDTQTIFVVSKEGKIAMIDARTAKVAKIFDGLEKEFEGLEKESSTGNLMLEGIAVDSASHTLYISSFGTNRITAIDTVTGGVTDTMQLRQPSGLAVDPRTHTLYAYSVGSVSVFPRKGLE